jgi:hypothetical protein
MPDTQLDIRAQQFSRNVVPLAQQDYSKFYMDVMQKSDVNAKSFSQDQIGKWSMQPKGGLNVATPQNDPNLQRRWAYISTFADARVLDRSVNLQILSDPKSEMTMNAARAIGRQMDENIYSAALGTAASGENGGTSNTLPAGQIIDSGGSTAMTILKFRQAGDVLNSNDVVEWDRHAWVSPASVRQLLSDDQATSADFVNVKNLLTGDIDDFYGFNVKWSTVLTDANVGNISQAVFFQKSGICAGTPEMLYIRTDELPTLSYSWQVYYELNIGTVRLEEEKVVRVDSDDSITIP